MKINVDEMPNASKLCADGLASAYAPGTHIERHTHDAHQLAHAIAGVLRVTAQEATWVVPPGRALWIPSGMEHEIFCVGGVEMRTVYLRGTHPSFSETLQVIGVSSLLREILVRMAEGFEARQAGALTTLLIEELATMQIQPLSLPMPNGVKLNRLAETLLTNPADGRSLKEWARELGYSPRNLIRHIQMDTGLSFRELRRQARILAAIEHLALGKSITDVAFLVGFSSPSAFTYAFRSVTGMTPRAYLKQN